jgi:tetratricopeptide (TPR) repeat protein
VTRLFLLVLVFFWAAPAHADPPKAGGVEGRADEPNAEPVDATTAEVRAHHRRGLELYDEGDLRLALVELERAYQIGKSYKVLFNIGQVYFQLKSYAKARTALTRYLAEGGDAITPERRADVERDLETLKTRTAHLTIHVNVEGAEVSIDETMIGRAPLEDALVDAGTLRVKVTRAGYASSVRDVTIVGGDTQTITIALMATKPDVIVTTTTTGLPGSTIAAWIGAGVLAAGTIGTGIAANAARSNYDTQRGTPISGSPEQARSDLERQRDLVRGLALTTDILAVTTIVVGAVALYLTLRERPKQQQAGL